jgi:soluble lytic murein transglycosylase-like protein
MPVSAATTPSPDPGTLQTQLDQALAKLTQINDQLQQAQTSLDTLNRELAADQQREKQLQQQVADLARLEYEQPVFNLTTLLTARSISQILGSMAQARLVSGRQQDLLSQASQVRQHQQQLRDSADGQLSQIKSARDQAAQIAAQALSSRNAALQSVATQAAAVACDPNGSGPNSCPSGSIQQIITGAFASQGQAAVTWGLRIAKCESGYNPRAVNPSGATGLFQFMPSTFANTPPGKAGGSIWDPVAQSQAAAWMYSQGRQGEWQCN